jgi:hypothetical protein
VDSHHELSLRMMNVGPASGYRDTPHTARGIPLSSNPTMTFARPLGGKAAGRVMRR